MTTTYWGVYRVFKNGTERYVGRSATHSEALARAIAADLSEGRVVRPDGSEAKITARPHVARIIGSTTNA